jgi:hypothetical protein
MKDTEHLIILDEKVKHKSLFGAVLFKVLCWMFLLGLTTYSLLSLLLSPTAFKFYKWFDSVDQKYVGIFCIVALAVFGLWRISKK